MSSEYVPVGKPLVSTLMDFRSSARDTSTRWPTTLTPRTESGFTR